MEMKQDADNEKIMLKVEEHRKVSNFKYREKNYLLPFYFPSLSFLFKYYFQMIKLIIWLVGYTLIDEVRA